MTRVICVNNKGYIELTIGADYYFDNFVAKNPFTNDTFGNLYVYLDDKYNCVGLYPHKLFKKLHADKGGKK